MANETNVHVLDPRLLQARNTIAQQLDVSAEDVTVKIGRDKKEEPYGRLISVDGAPVGDPVKTEELIITVHKKGLDLERPRLTEEIRAKLGELQPLADNAQMVRQEQLAVTLNDDIRNAVRDTNFNQALLEWHGFDPKTIAKGFEIGDYAVQNVRDNAYGVSMSLHFAHPPSEDPSAAVERFSELTKGRLPAIKEILVERVLKYTRKNMTERGLNAQEIDQVKAQAQLEGKSPEGALTQALESKIQLAEMQVRTDMAKLDISVNADSRERDNLVVTLRSPEQAEAYNKANPQEREYSFQTLPNEDELRNTNPLTSRVVSLTTQPTPATETQVERQPQLNKALARSFLFDKDKNVAPDALQIMGRNDIKAAIIKELMVHVLPKHPEKEAVLMEVINSELFKNHGTWHSQSGQKGVAKQEPAFDRPTGSNDTLEIAFTLGQDKDATKNQLLQVVEGLAAGGTVVAVPPNSAEVIADKIIADTPAADTSFVARTAPAAGGANIQAILDAGSKTKSPIPATTTSWVASASAKAEINPVAIGL